MSSDSGDGSEDRSGTDPRPVSWDVVVCHVAPDAVWAEWIVWHLTDAGYRVVPSLVTGSESAGRSDHVAGQQLIVLSTAYLATTGGSTGQALESGVEVVSVRVEDCPRQGPLEQVNSFDLFGLAPTQAGDWLRKQVAVSYGSPRPTLAAPPLPPARASASSEPATSTEPATSVAPPASTEPAAGAPTSPAASPLAQAAPGRRGQTAVMSGHRGGVRTVAFRADGAMLATGGNDSSVSLWDLSDPATARRILNIEYGRRWNQEWVRTVAFAPAAAGRPHLLAASGDGANVLLWDTTDPALPVELAQVTGHSGYIYGMAFSPDGTLLATSGVDRGVLVTDVTDPAKPVKITAFRAHRSPVNAVVFDPYQMTLATAGDDGTVVVWDLAGTTPGPTGNPVPTGLATLAAHRGAVHALAFSPDGRLLATAGKDGKVVVWDVTAGTEPARAAVLSGHRKSVNALAFSPDGTLLASGGKDKTVLLWDFTGTGPDEADGARTSATLTGHRGEVHSAAFSPDGNQLATGGDDGTAVLWTVR